MPAHLQRRPTHRSSTTPICPLGGDGTRRFLCRSSSKIQGIEFVFASRTRPVALATNVTVFMKRCTKHTTLARIIHKFSTAAAPSSALAAFCSVGLLDVLHKYDCGGLGRRPCQDGSVTASLRKLMNYSG